MAKRCSICGKKIGLMNPYAQFRDALACESCAKKYGAPLPSDIWWALVDTASIAKVTDLRADIEAIIAKHRYSERLEAWSEISNKIGLWLIKNPDDGCLLVWKNEQHMKPIRATHKTVCTSTIRMDVCTGEVHRRKM